MNNKLLSCLIAGALGATLALSPQALARGGGHGGGGMHGGGMHFGGGRFAGAHFAHAGFSPRFAHAGFSRAAFHHGFHHRFHHRFHRFAFVGAYASYDNCWRRAWTPYRLQWVNVCYGYGY